MLPSRSKESSGRMVWRALSLRVWCLSLMSLSSSIGGLSSAMSWPALHSPATRRRLSHQSVTAPLHQREHLFTGTFLTVPTTVLYCTEHGTAEPSCGVKTSSSIRLVFRFGLQQSPGARYSYCRSQSALGISQLRARPLRPHHQHHLLPRHHQHHLPPSLSLYRAQPVAITRPLRKPASGPTSIRYNLHLHLRPIRASAKSPTPTLTQPEATHRNHHMYGRCL
jgi:hypothetical protein